MSINYTKTTTQLKLTSYLDIHVFALAKTNIHKYLHIFD